MLHRVPRKPHGESAGREYDPAQFELGRRAENVESTFYVVFEDAFPVDRGTRNCSHMDYSIRILG